MTDLMAQAKDTFIDESLGLLREMEVGLRQLESEPENKEVTNSVFRAIHTIKGSAGMFGLDQIVAFSHKVENLLEQVRAGEVLLTGKLIEVLLSCCDHTEWQIEQLSIDDAEQPTSQEYSNILLKELEAATGQDCSAKIADELVVAECFTDNQNRVERVAESYVENDNWHISLRLHPEVLRNGLDPLSFLRYLNTIGTIRHVETLMDELPPAQEMDPEICYLGFEVMLSSEADKQTLMDVFEFLTGESSVVILPPHSQLQEYAKLIESLSESDDYIRIGELLVRIGALTERELELAIKEQKQRKSASLVQGQQPLGEILVKQQSVDPGTLNVALTKQQKIQEHKSRESKSIRVDAERLDQLITLVGELVIAGAGTNMLAHSLQNDELMEASELTTRLVEEIRDISLSLRMVNIGETLNRFNRVVRDVSRELEKDIKLVIEGGETELDKSVVEKIGDPLTHMVRNAIDHGIESAEIRAAQGKPAHGTIKLSACHDSGNIVIEVSDDGAGIDPDKVFAKALANGLIEPGQQLSEQDIYRLVLEPGLSTKEQVSNLSGRGVGMDVVKRNVESLRGSIEVDSQLGVGTSMRVRLPLTLSIIDGFVIGIGDSCYVIPLDVVVECINFADSDSDSHLSHNGDYINLRGEVLPYLDLRDLFQDKSQAIRRKNIIVVQCGNQKAGLVVDTLLGEYQTVIKPLSKIFARLSGISGSTILGSGEVAMILDVVALIKQAEQHKSN